MNNTVYFNPEWMEALSSLKEESRNMIISAIITYQVTGEMPTLPAGKAIFMLLKLEVDRRNRRLANAREKRLKKKDSHNPSPEKVASAVRTPEPSADAQIASAAFITPTEPDEAKGLNPEITPDKKVEPLRPPLSPAQFQPGVAYLVERRVVS